MIAITGPYPPAVFRAVSGKVMAAAGRQPVEVPAGTSLADIRWKKPHRAVVPKKSAPTTHLVPGSSGDRYEVVLWSDGTARCNCWGYRRWRKPCKHIKMVKVVGQQQEITNDSRE